MQKGVLKMRLNKVFNLLIISFLLASCSEEEPAYREIWQKAHHLDDVRMMEVYGEPGDDKDNMLGAILEAVDGNWDKVAHLTEGSRPSDIYAYYHRIYEYSSIFSPFSRIYKKTPGIFPQCH